MLKTRMCKEFPRIAFGSPWCSNLCFDQTKIVRFPKVLHACWLSLGGRCFKSIVSPLVVQACWLSRGCASKLMFFSWLHRNMFALAGGAVCDHAHRGCLGGGASNVLFSLWFYKHVGSPSGRCLRPLSSWLLGCLYFKAYLFPIMVSQTF